MKLVRYGLPGEERPGMIDADGKLRDLGAYIDDVDRDTVRVEKIADLMGIDPASLPEIGGDPRLGPPVAPKTVGKCICIGLNFSDHAEETGNPIPTEPIVFMKATSAITGPYDPVILPRGRITGS